MMAPSLAPPNTPRPGTFSRPVGKRSPLGTLPISPNPTNKTPLGAGKSGNNARAGRETTTAIFRNDDDVGEGASLRDGPLRRDGTAAASPTAVLSPIAKPSNIQGLLDAATTTENVPPPSQAYAAATDPRGDPGEGVVDTDPPAAAITTGAAAAVQGLVALAGAAQDGPSLPQDKLPPSDADGEDTSTLVAALDSFVNDEAADDEADGPYKEDDEAEQLSPSVPAKPARPSLKARALATDWSSKESIAENFPPYTDKSRYGQLQVPMAMLELYRQPLHKARAACHFRRLTNAQQHEVKPVYTKMAREARRAAEVAEKKRLKDLAKAEKDAEKKRKADERKAKTAANKRKRAEDKAVKAKEARAAKRAKEAESKCVGTDDMYISHAYLFLTFQRTFTFHSLP